MSTAQRLIDEGRREGHADVLLRQLETKFGAVDAALQERVKGADTEQIETWATRILSAATVEDVFGEG